MTMLDGHISFNRPIKLRRREPSDPTSESIRKNPRRDPRHCEAPNVTDARGSRQCGANTAGKKDRCLIHIGQRDYVQEVLDRVAQIEVENLLVLQYGIKHCKPEHNTALEIIQFLKNSGGAMTIMGLRKALQVDLKVATAYVKMLAKNGTVALSKSGWRKILTITLNG